MKRQSRFGLATVALALTGCSAETWQVERQDSGVTTSLRGLSVVSDQVVWIGAPEGGVLRTLDGGLSWQVTTAGPAEGADLRSAHGFDDSHALFVTAGQPARILETRDGGASFTIAWEDRSGSAFFDSLAFRDDRQGLAFSDPVDGQFLILRTRDGGASWEQVEGLPEPLDGEAGFAASNTSIALTPDGCAYIGTGGGAIARVLASCDFGESWVARAAPLAAGSGGAGIFALAAGPDGLLAAVGGDYQDPERRDGTFALTRDGGASWVRGDPQPNGYRSDISPLGYGWIAVGTNGVDLGRVSGDTISWEASGWEIAAPNAVAFSPSGETGWIIGANGGIWRLTAQ
ncbi:hypothetical protein AWH62_00225 [Maricaulis sp. W15]|uniref:WD40/YVTN/BNR-like repeat-containing protein n=1 Tax=Maricaulis sp. W15 TaxID=1772333 RepID=UPI0009690884|nr:hypothetical protein [Maricaulis sp. W15]OLF81137.1 hypothetical protein AWH62_00225 [Maricaulis sp. W15]